MKRRFSSEELTFLRNRVPIDYVIKDLLELRTRNRSGKLSFSCPLCGGFDTSINAAQNLARCFTCRQNFNPIELVMHQLHMGFVESVKWLKKTCQPAPAQDTLTRKKYGSHPTRVGDVLAETMPALSRVKADADPQSVAKRLSELERSVGHLQRLFDELRSSLK